MRLEFDQYITPDGIVVDLNDMRRRFIIGNISGGGMPPITYFTQKGPNQHGESIVSYRLKPRVIQMVIRENGLGRDQYWQVRRTLVNYFRPNRQPAGSRVIPGVLRKIMPDGRVRDLDVIVAEGPKFNGAGNNWDEFSVQEAIRFIAYDPIYYNPVSIVLVPTLVPTTGLVFPFTFPFAFGTSIVYTESTINYTGSWISFPIIRIYGPIEFPKIYNLTTDEQIGLLYTIPSGSYITIDTRYGFKTVIDSSGVNRIGVLSDDSDLATFHIAPDPEAPGGVNALAFVGENATGARFEFEYLTRDIAI